MVSKDEIRYRILKYALNNLKPRGAVSINKALEESGLSEYTTDSDDLSDDLKYQGLAEIKQFSARRVGITRVTIDGKYFVEKYLTIVRNKNIWQNKVINA